MDDHWRRIVAQPHAERRSLALKDACCYLGVTGRLLQIALKGAAHSKRTEILKQSIRDVARMRRALEALR